MKRPVSIELPYVPRVTGTKCRVLNHPPLREAWAQLCNNIVNYPPPDDKLTVGDPLVELVPVGDDDHEDNSEGNLDEKEAEDAHYSEGSHHGVRFLQIIDVDLVRCNGLSISIFLHLLILWTLWQGLDLTKSNSSKMETHKKFPWFIPQVANDYLWFHLS